MSGRGDVPLRMEEVVTGQPIAKSKDLFEGRYFRHECGSLYVHWSTLPRRAFLSRTIQTVWRRLCHDLALIGGYRLELRNFLRRIVLRSARQPYPMLLQMGPVHHSAPTGLPEECIRKRDCIRDIENFAAAHPTATVNDWAHFREGWEAGEKWSRGNQCSCTSAKSTS